MVRPTMPGRQLLELLDDIPDTGEIVIRVPSAPGGDELLEAWRSARAEANAALARWRVVHTDRKSTRLNSSHLVISYAVFCLKKKRNHRCVCDYFFRPQQHCTYTNS